MHAAPALQVDVLRFGVWRAAIGGLITTCLAVVCLWWARAHHEPAWLHLALTAAALLAVAGASTRLRSRPFRLRWDGERWHVGPANARDAEPWVGAVGVAIDFGGWMLLRFAPVSAPEHAPASGLRRCPYRWLPVQRRGLEAQWHALRGALYSARFEPSATTPSATAHPDRTE